MRRVQPPARGQARSSRLAALLCLLLGGAAQAQQVMELGPNGIRSSVDPAKPFKITAKSQAEAVYAVAVRLGYPAFGISTERSKADCAMLRDQLDEAFDQTQLTAHIGRTTSVTRPADPVRFDDLLMAGVADEAHRDLVQRFSTRRALVAGHWLRSGRSGDDLKDVAIDVNAPAFFRPGARYCLLLVEREADSASNGVALMVEDNLIGFSHALDDDGNAAYLDRCTQILRERDPSEEGAYAVPSSKADLETCAIAAVERDLTAFGALTEAEQRRAHELATTRLVQTGRVWITELREQVRAAAVAFDEATATDDDPFRTARHGSALLAPERAALVYELLARGGELVRMGDGRYTRGNKPVVGVEFGQENGSGTLNLKIHVPDGDTTKPETLRISPDKLFFPNHNVSLLDVWRLHEGYVRLSGADPIVPSNTWVRLADLSTPKEGEPGPLLVLTALATRPDHIGGKPITSRAVRAARQALITHLQLLLDLHATAADAADDPPDASPYDVYRLLAQATAPRTVEPRKGGFAKALQNLTQGLTALHERALPWDEALDALPPVAAASQVAATPLDPFGGFKQKSYFDHYVTTTVGAVGAQIGGRHTVLPMVAVHLYAAPNPVNEPMWTNGASDFGRLFSLDIGVGLATLLEDPTASLTDPTVLSAGFGPERRYSGPGKGPPWFLGVGLQLLPYVSVSGGMLLFEGTASGLGTERNRLQVAGAWTATAEINLVGLVRGWVSKGASRGPIE